MNLNFGLFNISINWTAKKNTKDMTYKTSIGRVSIPETIGSIFYGGYYAGEINGNAIVLSNIEGQSTHDWWRSFKFASSSRLAGYPDWEVPTPDELSLIYKNFNPDTTSIDEFKLGNSLAFRSIRYWTDREATTTFAYAINFGNSFRSTYQKNDTEGVRLIRRMKIIE